MHTARRYDSSFSCKMAGCGNVVYRLVLSFQITLNLFGWSLPPGIKIRKPTTPNLQGMVSDKLTSEAKQIGKDK